MNKRTLIFAGIFICCIVLSYFVFGGKNSDRQKIKHLETLEAGVENPSSVEELKEAIEKYEASADELLSLQEQTGNWYKILAVKYIDKEMYGEALSALQKAVQYYPLNQNLFYYIGVSAGFMAKASLDFNADGKTTERDNYLLLAESGYKRAVELEPDYFRALYGLAVLYVLEMNQPAKAVPLLEKALSIEEKNTDEELLNRFYKKYGIIIRKYYDKNLGGYLVTADNRQQIETVISDLEIIMDTKFAYGDVRILDVEDIIDKLKQFDAYPEIQKNSTIIDGYELKFIFSIGEIFSLLSFLFILFITFAAGI